MLNFSQGEDMTLGMYYKKFNTRVAIAESVGCIFMTETLLDMEAELLHPGKTYESLQTTEQVKVEKTARDKVLAGKRHVQLHRMTSRMTTLRVWRIRFQRQSQRLCES